MRNEQKIPPLIDPLLLEVALRSKFLTTVTLTLSSKFQKICSIFFSDRDPKQLEWNEPLLAPMLRTLRLTNFNPNQHSKIYDRLVYNKATNLCRPLISTKRTWDPIEDEESIVTMGMQEFYNLFIKHNPRCPNRELHGNKASTYGQTEVLYRFIPG